MNKEYLNFEDAAKLVKRKAKRLTLLIEKGMFPRHANTQVGEPFWSVEDVKLWAKNKQYWGNGGYDKQ